MGIYINCLTCSCLTCRSCTPLLLAIPPSLVLASLVALAFALVTPFFMAPVSLRNLNFNLRSTSQRVTQRVLGVIGPNNSSRTVTSMASGEGGSVETKRSSGKLSEGEWRAILSPEQFRVLRQAGTEYPGTGKYNKAYPKDGTFACAGCGNPLYTAKSKFDSGCGWPAFYEGIPDAIEWRTDADGRRTEILCAKCGGHLGHVFLNEGFNTPTKERHCVNSVSITYTE